MGDAYGRLSMVKFIGGNCTVGSLSDSFVYYIFKIKFNNDFNYETNVKTFEEITITNYSKKKSSLGDTF